VVKAAKEHTGPAFFMAGSNDKAYSPQALQQIQSQRSISTWIADGADHSLEIPDDPLHSLAILLAGMTALSTFLSETVQTSIS